VAALRFNPSTPSTASPVRVMPSLTVSLSEGSMTVGSPPAPSTRSVASVNAGAALSGSSFVAGRSAPVVRTSSFSIRSTSAPDCAA
jgi:hypothetical protein